MTGRMIRRLLPLLGALTLTAPAWAVPTVVGSTPVTRRAPPRRPARRVPPPAPVAPAPAPELVPVGAADLQNTLRRMRIYVMSAPDGARSLGALGSGAQLWFLLPSCRPPSADDPRAQCPIDRVEVEGIDGGVRAGAVVTVMAGEVPRRAQAFVLEPATAMVRVRLVGSEGAVRYEGVIAADEVRRLAAPQGRDRGDRFEFDFTVYPAR